MLFSRSVKYGMKSLPYMEVAPEGDYKTAKEVAEKTDAPPDFLGKIFQKLAKDGLLQSRRGRGGGFCLSRPGDEISLLEVVKKIDGEDMFDRCLFDLKKCGSGGKCPIHEDWRPIRDNIVEMLEETTVSDLEKD